MSGKVRGEGDWVCEDPDCANVNFARRTSCNRCGKEKIDLIAQKKIIGTEIGKAAAEKSRGLFSADDWQCSKCGNVNWARRGSCNMCNAPKFGEVEERTGYGGGYNDRGVVEYIEREDSEDEYDEFGRKKKKYRKTSETGDEKDEERPRKVVAAKDDEEEEDEEEDDDDGDLSKYDLTGWGDDEEEDKETKEEPKSDSKDKVSSSKSEKAHGSSRRSTPPRSSGSRDEKKRRRHSRSRSSSGSSRSRSRSRSRSPRYKSRH